MILKHLIFIFHFTNINHYLMNSFLLYQILLIAINIKIIIIPFIHF